MYRTKDEKHLKQWHLDWDSVECLDESLETSQSTEAAGGNSVDTKGDNSSSSKTGDPSNSAVNVGKDKTVSSENESGVLKGGKVEEKDSETLSNGPDTQAEEREQNNGEKNMDESADVGQNSKTVNGTLNGEAGTSSEGFNNNEGKPLPDDPVPFMRSKIEGPLFPVPSMTSLVSLIVLLPFTACTFIRFWWLTL